MVHIFNLRRKNMTALAAAVALIAVLGEYGPSEPSQYRDLQVCEALKLKMGPRNEVEDSYAATVMKNHGGPLPDPPSTPTEFGQARGSSLSLGQAVSSGLDVSFPLNKASLKAIEFNPTNPEFVKRFKDVSTASGPKSQTMDREYGQPVVIQGVVVSESDRDNCGGCCCDPCPTATRPIPGRTVDSGRQGIDSRQAPDECDLITVCYCCRCCTCTTEEVVQGCKDGCASCKCPSCGPCPTVEEVQAALSGVPAKVASAAGDVESAIEHGVSCCQSGAYMVYNGIVQVASEAGACCCNCLQCKCCGEVNCCAGCCSEDCCAGCDGCGGCDGCC